MALRDGQAEEYVHMRGMADDFFPLPQDPVDFWSQRSSAA